MNEPKITLLIIILLIITFSITGCKKENAPCGDNYDRCCDECYEYYKDTGLSTECYGNCWDNFAECEEDKDNYGCFINNLE